MNGGRVKELFLVELWREPPIHDAPGPWRGVVKHVAHDDEHYVAQLSDITTFIARAIHRAPPENVRTPYS